MTRSEHDGARKIRPFGRGTPLKSGMYPRRLARPVGPTLLAAVAALAACEREPCDWPDPAPESEPPPNQNERAIEGIWGETAWLDCESCELAVPAEEVRELIFHEDGRFWVTWYPFETYVDYWGDYAWDEESGRLELVVDGGNDIPEELDGVGSATIAPSGALVLAGIWLGSERDRPRPCGHRFEFRASD